MSGSDLRALCAAVNAAEDDEADEFDALVAEVRRDPDAAVRFVTVAVDCGCVVRALRRVHERFLDALIDLVPSEPEVRESVVDALGRLSDHDERRRIVERLGIEILSRAYNEAGAKDGVEPDEPLWWAVELVIGLERWADEELHRRILLQLVADADEESIWSVAASPVENFITDDDDRLRWVEQQAASNPRFRAALAGVWTSKLADPARARVAAIAPTEDEALTILRGDPSDTLP